VKRKTLAVPIRVNDFSNSSQVVSLFTREFGLVDGLAKGAHRSRSPFQGPFDLAVLYEVLFLDRRSAGLALLTEATVVDGFRGVRARWDRHVAAAHIVEFLRVVAVAGEGSQELFDLVRETLCSLAASPRGIESIVLGFDARALGILGLFGPAVACVECGRPWPEGNRPVFFSAALGGLVCRSCRERRPVRGALVPAATVRALNRLALRGGPRDAPPSGDEPVPAPVRRLVRDLRTNLLERQLVLLESTARWM
jgi:DNA repair protein RecO (recombination protein O)